MEEGYVRVYRKMLDSAVMDDDWLCRLWMWCLLRANYKDSQFKGQTIPAGSFVCGRVSAAERLGVSQSKFHRGLHKLQELGQVELNVNCKWTCVSLCNWRTYQLAIDAPRIAGELPVNGERIAGELLVDTSKEGKKGRREEGNNLGGEPPKNPKARKRAQKTPDYTQGQAEIPSELDTPEFRELWANWLVHRASISHPYASLVSERTALLNLLPWGLVRSLAAVKHSLGAGWRGIFEPDVPAKSKDKVLQGPGQIHDPNTGCGKL